MSFAIRSHGLKLAGVLCIHLLIGSAWSCADEPISPIIELQSQPLTPGMTLDESPRTVHQIRILVDAKLTRATLILDGNSPSFDEFGRLVGGLQTPETRGKGNPGLRVNLDCRLEFLREGPKKWRLYRLHGPDIRTPLRIAAKGTLGDGGPSRLIVVNSSGTVQAVIPCTRYGLIIP